MPNVFGPKGGEPLDAEAARAGFEAMAVKIEESAGQAARPRKSPRAFLRVAVENMANAIKRISVRRGRDATEYILQCFGGAGGQHACRVADTLGMTKVLIHPFSGVLSAYGMGLADVRVMREQTVEAVLTDNALAGLDERLDTCVCAAARARLREQGIGDAKIAVLKKLHLRYDDADTPLIVDFRRCRRRQVAVRGTAQTALRLYHERKAPRGRVRRRRGDWRGPMSAGRRSGDFQGRRGPGRACRPQGRVRWPARRHSVSQTRVWKPGATVRGPAVIVESVGTIVVDPGWEAEVNARNHLILTRAVPSKRSETIDARADPVMLEVFNNLFMNIAEQMGAVLANTACSVNIKERLDFSCALFDREGRLIANAPHMPVHLGSMGESVRAVIENNAGEMKSGDVYMLNDPYNGGTHLPDITLVTPVFDDDGGEVIFHVASRGHHADVGGIAFPAPCAPNSRILEEEGVLIDNFKLVDRGRSSPTRPG